MGKIDIVKGKIKFHYDWETVREYNAQPKSQIDALNAWGKPHGYSAMNIIYLFLIKYNMWKVSGKEIPDFIRNG